MSVASRFLDMYEVCKRTRTPEQCRQTVIAAAPNMLTLYLQSYDLCAKVWGPERCRAVFAPPREGVPKWTLAAAFAVGLFIGWRVLP